MSFSIHDPDVRDRVHQARFSARQLLRALRVASGMSQADLAARCDVSRPRIAEYEGGTTEPSFERLSALVEATGHRLVAIPTGTATARPTATAYETGARIATILAGDPGPAGHAAALRELRAYSIDLSAQDPPVQAALCVTAPAPTGSAHFDAALAAVVEHRLGDHGTPVPGWVQEPDRYLSGTWVADPAANLEPGAQLMPFLRHGIMVGCTFFDTARPRRRPMS
ncbi:MAG: helix-turn-helix transcriptional regulator [Acidimicrobiales bacterium]